MSSTHSANPLSCAVGLANLLEIKRLVHNAKKMGKILHSELERYKVRGFGLLAGIPTPTAELGTKVCEVACERGLLLIKTGKPSVKIAPPLSITQPILTKGLNILKGVLSDVCKY